MKSIIQRLHWKGSLILFIGVLVIFRYLFGEEVNGMAYVVFGVIEDGQKRSFSNTLQRVPVNGNSVSLNY